MHREWKSTGGMNRDRQKGKQGSRTGDRGKVWCIRESSMKRLGEYLQSEA